MTTAGEPAGSKDAGGGTAAEGQRRSLRQLLQQHGLSPQKRLGQNFMVDTNFAAAVARAAEPDARTLIIEVGPGTGCLTRALLAADPAARVLAIELDGGLAQLLKSEFAPELTAGRLTLQEGDALAGKHALSAQLVAAIGSISGAEHRPRRVLCANLPYNAATPLLANLALDEQHLAIETAVVTIQLEVAERMLAGPSSDDYGALSVLFGLRAIGAILRRVGSGIFWPRPAVDSAVVRLDFRPWPAESGAGLRREEALAFQQFLRKIFSQRRKMLRAVLKPAGLPPRLGLKPDARAEDLPPEVLLNLFRAVSAADKCAVEGKGHELPEGR